MKAKNSWKLNFAITFFFFFFFFLHRSKISANSILKRGGGGEIPQISVQGKDRFPLTCLYANTPMEPNTTCGLHHILAFHMLLGRSSPHIGPYHTLGTFRHTK
ncbi:UNVERIFIED_CONTAM: hypothetical protein K2H54_034989 [Gekko kuhli]